jgi:hypothetical protein
MDHEGYELPATVAQSTGALHPGDGRASLRGMIERMLRAATNQPADLPPGTSNDLRAALRDVCAEAHQRELRPEQLQVLVKVVNASLPVSRQQHDAPDLDELLGELLSSYVDGHRAHTP